MSTPAVHLDGSGDRSYGLSGDGREGAAMDDREILQRIGQLADEEHQLYQRAEAEHGLSEDEMARRRGLEVLLDQCWDLLRQRRARREFGLDPDAAQPRDATTVERYTARWWAEQVGQVVPPKAGAPGRA